MLEKSDRKSKTKNPYKIILRSVGLIQIILIANKTKTLTWHCCMRCNPANGRVDFEEWSAYKIQLHGTEWIVSVSLSADWDQSPPPPPKKKKKNGNWQSPQSYLLASIEHFFFSKCDESKYVNTFKTFLKHF